jgi:hypothetical protein
LFQVRHLNLRRFSTPLIGGIAILEGDIAIGSVDDVEAQRQTLEPLLLPNSGIAFGIGLVPERFRWPRGIVPFEIEL